MASDFRQAFKRKLTFFLTKLASSKLAKRNAPNEEKLYALQLLVGFS